MGFKIQLIPIDVISKEIQNIKKDKNMCISDFTINDEFHLSYNFCVFKDIWCCSDYIGKKTDDCLAILVELSKELYKQDIIPCIPTGMNIWTADLQVFHYNIQEIIKFMSKYPNHILYEIGYENRIYDFFEKK